MDIDWLTTTFHLPLKNIYIHKNLLSNVLRIIKCDKKHTPSCLKFKKNQIQGGVKYLPRRCNRWDLDLETPCIRGMRNWPGFVLPTIANKEQINGEIVAF